MTKTFACQTCNVALSADYARATLDTFLVACPKCGQRYRMRKPIEGNPRVQTPEPIVKPPQVKSPPTPQTSPPIDPVKPNQQTFPANPGVRGPKEGTLKRNFKPWIIGIISALLLGGGIWGTIELSKRHTLTETERTQANGWFKDMTGKSWFLLQQADDTTPNQSMTISGPSVAADNYGKTTVTVSMEISGYSDAHDHGHFSAKVERPYTDLDEPRELELSDDNHNAGEGSSLTWRIINADSITIVLRTSLGTVVTYFGIPADRFTALRAKSMNARKMSLVHTVDSLTQNGGLLRRGIFRSYACGDECVASFLIMQNGQPEDAAYVCNNNRFGAIQLSQGNMLGEGDFTNQTLVGQSFLIITQRTLVETPDGNKAPLDVITGLLPITNEDISPELQQRLAVATNVDMLAATGLGASNTSSTAQQYVGNGTTRELKDVQEQPIFPGGIEALYTYLSKNVRYPSMESDAGIQGRVFVEFVVSSDGSITEVVLKRGVSGGLDKEAIRVVGAMPRWSPGRVDGQPVRVRYILPVNFVLR